MFLARSVSQLVSIVAILLTPCILSSCSGLPGDTDCGACIYLPENNSDYRAFHIDEAGDTTHYKIQLKSSSSWFLLQKKLQYTVTRFESTNSAAWDLKSESTTGFAEDARRIWLHPPRVDKFKYITQLAPYPEVLFPIKVGDTIDGKIHMLNNWGEWSGKSSTNYLTVADTQLDKSNSEMLYLLKGCGYILHDTSCVEYLFSLTKGFVRAHYTFNGKEHFYMILTGAAKNDA